MAARLTDEQLLARLVTFDTSSGRPTAPLGEFVAEYLERAGCHVSCWPDAAGQQVNVLARRGPDEPAGLLLSGHVDVVPASEPGWQSNPFELACRNGRYFGRGVADMKGFVALAINRLALATDLPRPLALLLTHDEERGCLGAQRFARENADQVALPRDVLVGEPTRLTLVRMHKGHLRAAVHVSGKAAHSGYPHLGQNAIARAGPVIVALARVADDLGQVRAETSAQFPECPYPVLNLGLVSGGSAVNIVPERCRIDLGIRLLPGQEPEVALGPLRSALVNLPEPVRGVVQLELRNESPPMLCDPHARINVELAGLLGQRETHGVSFASDAGVLARLGLNCVLFGPGRIEDAHQADESLEVEQFVAGGRWLDRIIARFCGEETP